MTSDIGYVLDRLAQLNKSDPSGKFTGRLDMTRVGVFGHSFGGAQAAQFCSQDSRCKAGIDVDGSLHGTVIGTGIPTPFMFLGSSEGDFSSSAEVRLLRSPAFRWVLRRLGKLGIDGDRQLAVTAYCLHTFFDDYLQDSSVSPSKIASPLYPEIQVLK